MMIQLGLIIASALEPVPVIGSHEPRAPSAWMQSIQAKCGRSPLVISGYGPSVLRGAMPKVTRNGQPLSGKAMGRLMSDLSNGRAVYRFSVQCGRRGDITIRIYEGEKQRDGGVRYRAALAVIIGNRLNLYVPLEPADAEAFWWR